MVWDIFKIRTQNQILGYKKKKNSLNNMLSDSWKSAFKMASEDPQKNKAKKYKNMKLSGFF